MEQTLGKRIVANRKRLGMTQDQLAERLGVTAQAVSKWENDQSCPDITMLPRLAEIFGITTDALLGLEAKTVHEAEVVEESGLDEENAGNGRGTWEFQWDNSRKGTMGMAVWALLVGGLLLASSVLGWNAGFWEILWPSGLVVFGLFGLLPRPSIFPIGCLFFGLYFLFNNLNLLPFAFGKEVLLPVLLLMFGLSLLLDALKKPRKFRVHAAHNGKQINQSNFELGKESFSCSTSFGENRHRIELPRLSRGEADVSFGQLVVDLSGCQEVADGCRIELNCSFGELELLVPRRYRVEPDSSTAFGVVNISGNPDGDPAAIIKVEGNSSFGEIAINYI